MMYPYTTLWDETEICHSQIIDKNGHKTVEVHFEKPVENGFCTARCTLPDYTWTIKEGFTAEEMKFFTEFLEHNAHLIFKYANEGGMQIA